MRGREERAPPPTSTMLRTPSSRTNLASASAPASGTHLHRFLPSVYAASKRLQQWHPLPHTTQQIIRDKNQFRTKNKERPALGRTCHLHDSRQANLHMMFVPCLYCAIAVPVSGGGGSGGGGSSFGTS